MPCTCACACTCAQQQQLQLQLQQLQQQSALLQSQPPGHSSLHSTAYPHSVVAPGSGKKAWMSYDEADSDTEYGFQRKKRFGGRNGSDAVRTCLNWEQMNASQRRRATIEQQQQQQQGEDNDAEGAEPRYRQARTEAARREDEQFVKIGHPLTCGSNNRHSHSCKCTNAHEMLQLKAQLAAQQAALQRNAATTERLAAMAERALANQKNARQHVCGCGCVSYGHSSPQQCSACGIQQRAGGMQAWQQLPLQQVLDNETAQTRHFDNNEGVSTRSAEGQQAQQQQPSVQEKAVQVGSTTGTPQKAAPPTRPATAAASRAKQAETARALAKRLASAHLGEGTTHPAVGKRGLGNTMLGSPFDPRELHDPESIDPVWRRRQAAREKSKRLNALLGQQPADKSVIDERQYQESMEKQLARRIKIQAFEKRHEEQRLAQNSPGPFTRSLSETAMAVLSGKPPFCAFGNGNTAPASGGLVYGNYLSSHNVSPEKAPNHPNAKQCFDEARRVRAFKRKQDAKSLRRLLKQVENQDKPEERALLWAAAESMKLATHPRGSASAPKRQQQLRQQQQQQYQQGGEYADELGPQQLQRNGVGISAVSLSQRAQDGNARNIGGGALGDPSSPSHGQQQQQQQQGSGAASARLWHGDSSGMATLLHQKADVEDEEEPRTGRRGNYEDSVVNGNRNTLAETAARTMSVLPLPERQPSQVAW